MVSSDHIQEIRTLSREAAEHVAECESCRRLVKALDTGHTSLELPRAG